ncbi:MAG: glycosyltransferase [Candidatus Cloacimonetes bacterium]|nr:glycosyltransferase [Candidatus Cloacimonadota bacterium]
MRKILFFVTRLDIGGIENYLLRFLTYKNHIFNATVLSKSGQAGMLDSVFIKQNVNIELLKLSYFSLLDYWKLYKYIKYKKFDTVCDFTGDFSGIVLLVTKLAKIKKRLVFYRSSDYRFKKTLFRRIYAKVMNLLVKRFATKILSNSRAALERFHPSYKVKPGLFQVIDNGIPDYDNISTKQYKMIRNNIGVPIDAFLIGHVGRYNFSKNHKQILSVAEALINKYDNVYFFLCGRGVKDNLNSSVKQKNLDDRIILYNSRNDVWQLLQSFDAFYYPSIVEGQPNALLEAMSVGLPFVSSDILTIKECVPEEFHKYLISANDSNTAVELLSTFIEQTVKDDFHKVQTYIKNRYDATTNFNKFLKEL